MGTNRSRLIPLLVVSIAVLIIVGAFAAPGGAFLLGIGDIDDIGVDRSESQTIHDIEIVADSDPVKIEVGEFVEAGAEFDSDPGAYEISGTDAIQLKDVTIEDPTTSNATIVLELSDNGERDTFDLIMSNIDTTGVTSLDSSLESANDEIEYRVRKDDFAQGYFSANSDASATIDSDSYDHEASAVEINEVQLENQTSDYLVVWTTTDQGGIDTPIGVVQGKQGTVSIEIEELNGDTELIVAVHPGSDDPYEDVIYAGDTATVEAPNKGIIETSDVRAIPDDVNATDAEHSITVSTIEESAATEQEIQDLNITYSPEFAAADGDISGVENIEKVIYDSSDDKIDLTEVGDIQSNSTTQSLIIDFTSLDSAPTLSDGDELTISYTGVKNPTDIGNYSTDVTLRDENNNKDTTSSILTTTERLEDGDVGLQAPPRHYLTTPENDDDPEVAIIEIPFNISIDESHGAIDIDLGPSGSTSVDLNEDVDLYSHNEGQMIIYTTEFAPESPIGDNLYPRVSDVYFNNIQPEGEGNSLDNESEKVRYIGTTISDDSDLTVYQGTQIAIENDLPREFNTTLLSDSESIEVDSDANSQSVIFDTQEASMGTYSVDTDIFEENTQFDIMNLGLEISTDETKFDTNESVQGEILTNSSDRSIELLLKNESDKQIKNQIISVESSSEEFELESLSENEYTLIASDLNSGVSDSASFNVVDQPDPAAEIDESLQSIYQSNHLQIPLTATEVTEAGIIEITNDAGDGATVDVDFSESATTTLRVNTYAAGTDAEPVVAASDGSATLVDTDGFPAGEYTVTSRADPDGTDPDDATSVTLADHPPRNATLYAGSNATTENLTTTAAVHEAIGDDRLEPADRVTSGDAVVYAVTAPGLDGLVDARTGHDRLADLPDLPALDATPGLDPELRERDAEDPLVANFEADTLAENSRILVDQTGLDRLAPSTNPSVPAALIVLDVDDLQFADDRTPTNGTTFDARLRLTDDRLDGDGALDSDTTDSDEPDDGTVTVTYIDPDADETDSDPADGGQDDGGQDGGGQGGGGQGGGGQGGAPPASGGSSGGSSSGPSGNVSLPAIPELPHRDALGPGTREPTLDDDAFRPGGGDGDDGVADSDGITGDSEGGPSLDGGDDDLSLSDFVPEDSSRPDALLEALLSGDLRAIDLLDLGIAAVEETAARLLAAVDAQLEPVSIDELLDHDLPNPATIDRIPWGDRLGDRLPWIGSALVIVVVIAAGGWIVRHRRRS